MELESVRNEVLRKIGRNLLLFQDMERKLKFVVANGEFNGYVSDLPAIHQANSARVQKMTMGPVVGEFVDNHLSDTQSDHKKPENLREAWISFRLCVETDPDYFNARRETLADIVAERNELVHHFLQRFDIGSVESLKEANQYLDKQRQRVLVEVETLRELVVAIPEAWRSLSECLEPEDVVEDTKLAKLRQSRLVAVLGAIAQQVGRDDGCVLLQKAIDLIKQRAGEEYAAMANQYGYKSLKALILATGLFDIVEEPTRKGGIRVYYRLKPGRILQERDSDQTS